MSTKYKVGDVVAFQYAGPAANAGVGYSAHIGEECVLTKHIGFDEWYVRFPTAFDGRMRDDVWLSESYMSPAVEYDDL